MTRQRAWRSVQRWTKFLELKIPGKTCFLCNQKKTTFFLLVMPANKSFDTAAFSKKLGVSHMSFAPPEKMLKHLGTTPGSASVAGLLVDEDDYVQVIVDKEVAESEWFGCKSGHQYQPSEI